MPEIKASMGTRCALTARVPGTSVGLQLRPREALVGFQPARFQMFEITRPGSAASRFRTFFGLIENNSLF